jgi:NAD(P)-dependent dehydrogenase (short-subunit alcohol dehydrogenase family)
MAAAAVDRYGSLDILCANAGIFPAAKLDAMSGSEFDTVLATNLRGTFLSVSACLPLLKKPRVVLLLPHRLQVQLPDIPAGHIMARAKQANSDSFARPPSSLPRRG